MSKAKKRTVSDADGADLYSDQDFDLVEFIGSMETESERRHRTGRKSRADRVRIDDRHETRWLRDQLQDWDDWKD